jgi:hypothetical protein
MYAGGRRLHSGGPRFRWAAPTLTGCETMRAMDMLPFCDMLIVTRLGRDALALYFIRRIELEGPWDQSGGYHPFTPSLFGGTDIVLLIEPVETVDNANILIMLSRVVPLRNNPTSQICFKILVALPSPYAVQHTRSLFFLYWFDGSRVGPAGPHRAGWYASL